MGQESRRVEWEQLVIRRISAGWSSCCGNPNLAGDGADEWAGSLCVAQGYSGEIANLANPVTIDNPPPTGASQTRSG